MAKKWVRFPHADAYGFDVAALRKNWTRLHRGDSEPVPKDSSALDAWRNFHAGDFSGAVQAGLAADGAGIKAAIKAQAIYANYLEKADKDKLALFEEAAKLADEHRKRAPADANAHYLYAYALGRYSQGISVTKALAQGFGSKIKEALLTALNWTRSTRKRIRRTEPIRPRSSTRWAAWSPG